MYTVLPSLFYLSRVNGQGRNVREVGQRFVVSGGVRSLRYRGSFYRGSLVHGPNLVCFCLATTITGLRGFSLALLGFCPIYRAAPKGVSCRGAFRRFLFPVGGAFFI